MRLLTSLALLLASTVAHATIPTLPTQQVEAGVAPLKIRELKVLQHNSGALVFTSSKQPNYIFTIRRNVNHGQSSWQVEALPKEGHQAEGWVWQQRWGMEQASSNSPVKIEKHVSNHVFGIDEDLDFVWSGLIPSVSSDGSYFDAPSFIPFRRINTPHINILFGHWKYHPQLEISMPNQVVFKNNRRMDEAPAVIDFIVTELADPYQMPEAWPLITLKNEQN